MSVIRSVEDLCQVTSSPELLGAYFIYDKVGEVPITQLMLCKNSAAAKLSFYEFCLERKSKNLNPDNYALMISGFVTLPFYTFHDDYDILNPFEVVDGKNVKKDLLESGILLEDIEGIQPTNDTKIEGVNVNE